MLGLGVYQGFFVSNEQKNDVYNNAVELIEAVEKTDPDVAKKMGVLYDEFRRINREFDKLAQTVLE
jgi:hypothetical protein